MLHRADTSFSFAIVAALAMFFIGAVLTTVVPPMIDKSWTHPALGLKPYTALELKGRAIYTREGCWYCHTQQTRTLVADTKRSGWRGVDSPISTPDEFVYDSPHMFGTKRTGPDLSRVGGKYDTQWHRTHFRNPRDLVPGSVMPPFPWIANNEEEFTALVAYIQTLGRAKDWRPDHDYEK
jgi:cytochrome c oxidase cbb3-type subunit II